MKIIVASLTLVLALVSGGPALAQSGDLGSILGGLLSGRGTATRSWHGHLVQASGTTMIFRAEDGKIYAVDMSAIDSQTWHPIALGQALTLAAKPGPEAQTLIAARIEREQPDRAGQLRENRAFRTVHGTVERVEGSQVTVRSSDGTALPVDVSRITGEEQLRANDGAVVILEPGQGNTVVWIAREDRAGGGWFGRQETQPSASVAPTAVGTGGYQRLHGYVQSVASSTLMFKADDGRVLTVDTSQVDARVRSTVRPGDLVSVVGKTTARADEFVAEVIERETRR